MIVWGWGKVTKKFIGGVIQRSCSYCNQTSIWQLCIVRTWFTLFFIPIIPYKKSYQITCPSCGSYIELTQEQFDKMKLELEAPNSSGNTVNDVSDSLKYAGKTESQINYLKQMEEYHKTQAENN